MMKKTSITDGSGESLICFVTTVYKGRPYLPVTLNSMARQTCKRFIHLIYVDGDDESYEDMVSSYSALVENGWPRIMFRMGKNNLGCDMAHQFCFANLPSECTHFCWLDAGDWLESVFVERFYRRFAKNSHCGWFRFNSIHYSMENEKPVGKDSYHSRPRCYAKAREQWPSIAFGQFYYHVMVIDKKVYQKINPNWLIADRDEHNGAFYDSQIVYALLVARVKVCYDTLCLVHIMADPNSVASGFRSKKKSGPDFMYQYLHKLALSRESIDLFFQYKRLCYRISQWNARILSGCYSRKVFKQEYHELTSFLKKHDLPKWFFARKPYYRLLLFLVGAPFFLAAYLSFWKRLRG